MRKFLGLVAFSCLIIAVYTGNVLATSYDFGDATGYGAAYNSSPDWQRLGTLWDAESSQKADDTSDDGVSWSVDGGVTYGWDDIEEGDDVTFKFVMYKYEWGRHVADLLKVWIDWGRDGSFDGNSVYQNAWYFKTDSGDAGQTPTTPYAYGDGLAQIYKTFTYTVNDIDVDPGDYWLRARVACNADVGSLDNFKPTGHVWQGETEDWKFTVKSVPEPATLLLLGLGLIGLVGVRRKFHK